MQRFTVASFVAGQAMRFTRDENGATAIEYAIIASGIAMAIVAVVTTVGDSVVAMFTLIAGLFS